MQTIVRYTWLLICLLINIQACNGQMKNNLKAPAIFPDRQPAVAGSFYPSQPELLKKILKENFAKAEPPTGNNEVLAIISPHAGYVYSAKVAASAFNQIDTSKNYEHIFIIGSSHRVSFNGASVYPGGHFITPLGAIPIDTLAETLSKENGFTDDIYPHTEEHSLEVQLPFLQYLLQKKFTIIPIVIGTQSAETCKKIAKGLKPYFTTSNLFVFSTDFSHYPDYESAKKADNEIADAITRNSASDFIKTKNKVEKEGTSNLLTGVCGWTSILTLLNISEGQPDIKIKKIDYQNSGDVGYGDKSRVVGYVALAVEKSEVVKKAEEFALTEADKTILLKIARNTVEGFVKKEKNPEIGEKNISENIKQQAGAFVTLTKNGELRGCIGTFKPTKDLYNVVQEMAVSAASRDYRFEPVSANELSNIHIEISVLTPLKKISSIDEIEIGKHGIYIVKGNRSGTLLPQVATKRNWSREDFLGYCSRDKVGIGWDGWKDAEIYIYEAIIFSENEH
jgi:AmmeMemoRadiSam system protein B/AmmeMemoRadiSam system protein A